jgi:hypothetical protein
MQAKMQTVIPRTRIPLCQQNILKMKNIKRILLLAAGVMVAVVCGAIVL